MDKLWVDVNHVGAEEALEKLLGAVVAATEIHYRKADSGMHEFNNCAELVINKTAEGKMGGCE
jgi:hypothetical protein